MPRIALTATKLSTAGVADAAEANGDTVNGHVVVNTGRTVITVRNADASNPHTVTFITPGTVAGLAIADHAVSIPASATRKFAGFDPSIWGGALSIDVDSAQLKLSANEP